MPGYYQEANPFNFCGLETQYVKLLGPKMTETTKDIFGGIKVKLQEQLNTQMSGHSKARCYIRMQESAVIVYRVTQTVDATIYRRTPR